MRFTRMAVGGLAAVATLVAGGCSVAAPRASQDGPVVVASTTQTADFAERVLGGRGEVIGLIRPNQSPHHHEVTPADVSDIARADVVVHGGVGLTDAWLPAAIDSAGFSGTEVDAARGVELRERVEDGQVQEDPHIWHDPDNAKIMTQNVARAIERADPEHREVYERNAQAYLGELDELEERTRRAIEEIPPEQRKIVTTHGAFGYYCDHYGLRFVGSVIPSFDDKAELSSKRVDDFVAQLRRTNAKAIFTEATIPTDVVRAVADEAHVEIVSDPLYADNNGPGLDYLATEKHNTDVIVSHLR